MVTTSIKVFGRLKGPRFLDSGFSDEEAISFSRRLKSSLALSMSLLGPLLSSAVVKVDGLALANY